MNIYLHYKGGRYVLLFVAETHHHNGDLDAVYVSMTTGKIVTRPYNRDSRNDDSWTDAIAWPDGVLRQRFILEDPTFHHMDSWSQSNGQPIYEACTEAVQKQNEDLKQAVDHIDKFIRS